MLIQSHKGSGGNPKALAERPDLANIEIPFAGKNFRNYPLAANLVQIALLEAVLLHQKLQRLYTRRGWQWVMLGQGNCIKNCHYFNIYNYKLGKPPALPG